MFRPKSPPTASRSQQQQQPLLSAVQESNLLVAYRQKQALAAAYLYLQQQPAPLYQNFELPKLQCSSPNAARPFEQSKEEQLINDNQPGAEQRSSLNFDNLNQLLKSQSIWNESGSSGYKSNSDSFSTICKTPVRQSYVVGAASTAAASAKFGDRPETVWTGTMPVRVYKNARFSQKLFVGGLPLMVRSEELQKGFSALGSVRIMLPKSRNPTTASQINGYCHIVAKDGKSIKRLLSKCEKSMDNPDDSITRIAQSYEYFFDLQLKSTVKRVQIIPWCINDSNYTNQMNSSAEKHVVFVGALHGIMTAEFLGRVMSDLFGNIEFVALDTDRFEYPNGSARVGFTNRDSYMKALRTNFVKIKTIRFTKVVQIEPYLEDSPCSLCTQCMGANFCKSVVCFRYYCSQCWERVHAYLDREAIVEHVRLVKKRQDGAE